MECGGLQEVVDMGVRSNLGILLTNSRLRRLDSTVSCTKHRRSMVKRSWLLDGEKSLGEYAVLGSGFRLWLGLDWGSSWLSHVLGHEIQ